MVNIYSVQKDEPAQDEAKDEVSPDILRRDYLR